MEQKVLLKVEGMDCANCAQTITRTLSKEKLKDVNVDFLTGEVSFDEVGSEEVSRAIDSIHKLGYKVNSRSDESITGQEHSTTSSHAEGSQTKFLIALMFTIPLVSHMFLPFAILHNPYFQLALSIPVMIIGFMHFGKSAFYSIRSGYPNMDVLIFIGSTSAFIYSLTGLIMYGNSMEAEKYLFFETAASIITLVLLGALIEQRSVRRTTGSIEQLSRLQPQTAKRIINKNGKEEIEVTPVTSIETGEHISISSGDRVPADGKIIRGEVLIDESMLTGESVPVTRLTNENVTGGTYVQQGQAVFEVTGTGSKTVLAQIIEIVKRAQHSKPRIQKLGDRISNIFVPIVLLISVVTFVISYWIAAIPLSSSLMHSIAVLVISCPCAMGLATPTAVMVGLGMAARKGILIKGGSSIEQLSGVKTIVFDKTGTLTNGKFRIKNIRATGVDEDQLRKILFSIEQHSSHPIAKGIVNALSHNSYENIRWKNISEDKGIGINATDETDNLYSIGSNKMVRHLNEDLSHDVYVLRNNKVIGYIDVEDEVKPGVGKTIEFLRQNGYRVVMISGDREIKCQDVANSLNITEYYSEKLPIEKLHIIENLSKDGPVAMVGDGINDAPALTRADIGISLSNSTDIAVQSAEVILLAEHDFDILIGALRISKLTFRTIKQNLFWAFFYNVIAIPVAAFGLLSPAIAVLSMAFSDVIVIGNSLRLRTKKL
jgi:Cu+-exporting ATPase